MGVVYWSMLNFTCARVYRLCNIGIVVFFVIFETISFTGRVNSTFFDFLSDDACWLAVSLADTSRLLLCTFRSQCVAFWLDFSIVNELLVSLFLLLLGWRVHGLVLIIEDSSFSRGSMRAYGRRNICLIASSLVLLVSSELINADKFKRVWINLRVIAALLVRCI